MMVVIPETNRLTLSVPDDGCYSLKVKRLVSGITTIIRYAQSQKIGFWNNNHHQVRSLSLPDDGCYSRNQYFDFELT
jgi:hypothetical protein